LPDFNFRFQAVKTEQRLVSVLQAFLDDAIQTAEDLIRKADEACTELKAMEKIRQSWPDQLMPRGVIDLS